MAQNAFPHHDHPIEYKARNEQEAFQEMVPFALYAALPILITITIAFVFGTTQ